MPRKAAPKGKGPVREETIPGSANHGVTLAALKGIPAFQGMNDADASTFLSLMTVRKVGAGEPVLREGQRGEGLFVILEGSMSITKKNDKGGEREVAVLDRHEIFGEAALVSDRLHTASAKGRQECRLLFLPREEFQRLLLGGNQGATSILAYFARVLAGRLEANNRRMLEIIDVAQRPASSEFAEFKRRLLKEWTF